MANNKDFRQASDAASFVFVAGIVYSNVRPGVQAAILETAIDSNVALYLKLGFKVVGEWTPQRRIPFLVHALRKLKMVPMKYR